MVATYIGEALVNLTTAVIAGLIVYDLTHRDNWLFYEQWFHYTAYFFVQKKTRFLGGRWFVVWLEPRVSHDDLPILDKLSITLNT